MNNVTVEEALKKGRIRLVYLPMLMTFGIIGLGIYLGVENIFGGWIFPVAFIVGFSSGWLSWSYFVVEWKIWAYENVRNINELQRKAVKEKLIWDSGSWFEKTEFKNYQQKQKLKQLEKKFLEKDIYYDDLSVTKETKIYYSKVKTIYELIIGISVIGLGGYIFYNERSDYFWIVLIAIGAYLLFISIKKYSNKSPQIILNSKGIKLNNCNEVSWNEVFYDEVFSESNGKSSTNYLSFNDEKISIDDLDVTVSELEKLLKVYRVRFEKENLS